MPNMNFYLGAKIQGLDIADYCKRRHELYSRLFKDDSAAACSPLQHFVELGERGCSCFEIVSGGN